MKLLEDRVTALTKAKGVLVAAQLVTKKAKEDAAAAVNARKNRLANASYATNYQKNDDDTKKAFADIHTTGKVKTNYDAWYVLNYEPLYQLYVELKA